MMVTFFLAATSILIAVVIRWIQSVEIKTESETLEEKS